MTGSYFESSTGCRRTYRDTGTCNSNVKRSQLPFAPAGMAARRLQRGSGMLGATNRGQSSVLTVDLTRMEEELRASTKQQRSQRAVSFVPPEPPKHKLRPQSAPLGGSRKAVTAADLTRPRVAELLCQTGNPQLIQGDMPKEVRAVQLMRAVGPTDAKSAGTTAHEGELGVAGSTRGRAASARSECGGDAQNTDKLLGVLQSRARTRVSITPLFRAMNVTRAGGVEYTDFVEMMRRLGMRESDQQLLALARRIDKSNVGKIVYADLAAVVTPEEMDDGMITPHLKPFLAIAEGKVPRPTRPFSACAAALSASMPEAPPAMKFAYNTRAGRPGGPPISAWGGTHPCTTDAEAPAPEDPDVVAARKDRARARAEERREIKDRHEVESVFKHIRVRAEIEGSVTGALGELESDSGGIVTKPKLAAALEKMSLKPSDRCLDRIINELDDVGTGQIHYREFVSKVLSKLDRSREHIGDIGDGDEERGLAGVGYQRARSVSSRSLQHERQTASSRAKRVVPEFLSGREKAEAVAALELLREKLQERYENSRDAFKNLDVDEEATLTYADFESQLQAWMPQLSEGTASRICRLLDVNGEGIVDVSEFRNVISGTDDNPKTLRAGVARDRDRRQLQDMRNGACGRFGATPASSYGLAAREAMMGVPGSSSYASDAQRFCGGSISLDSKPEFQVADETRKARSKHTRDLRNGYYLQRSQAISAALQAKSENSAERRLNSAFEQRMRYNAAIALEQRSNLRLF